MNFAITGAGGFLGTEILRQLSKRKDVTVYAFTSDLERVRSTFINAKNIVALDNSKAEKFDYSGMDVLLNCAFPRNVDDASFALGLDFIGEVLDKASDDNVKSVVNISSQSVYSQKRRKPANEETEIVLESKYAVGKYMSELLVNSLFKDTQHTNLRMASLIGVGFNQRITNKFVAKVIAGEQITIIGGKQLFGFMDVRDAASGIIRLMCGQDHMWQEAYNFGNNQAYSLLEIAQKAILIGAKFNHTTPALIFDDNDIWQNSSLVCDKFYKDFEWKPQYDIDSTLTDIFSDLVKNGEDLFQ